MRNAGVLAIAGLTALVGLTGCSAAGGCSGVHQAPAYVTIDATAWTSQHPGESVKACLDDVCSTVLQKQTLKAATVEPTTHRYRITLTGSGVRVFMNKRVPNVGQQTGCGATSRQAATIILSAAGKATLHAGN